MARIRTIKPEAFQSESLGNVSLGAERTFFGMWTIADDQGRHRDQAAVINGALWPLRPGHTPEDLELELKELEAQACVCRYVGCDGKRYLHVVNWDHQKIDHPSKPRQPPCLEHEPNECWKHGTECPGPPIQTVPDPRESLASPRHAEMQAEPATPSVLDTEGSRNSRESLAQLSRDIGEPSASEESPGQGVLVGPSRESREGLGSPQGALDVGPRTVVPSTEDHIPPSAASQTTHETANQRANRLAKVYTDQVKPSNFPAIAKIVKKAVDADCSDELITAGLQCLVAEGRSVTTDALRIAMYGKPQQARSPGSTPTKFTDKDYANARFK